MAALSSDDPSAGPGRENLDQFLAKLPELWRAGEARPTHRNAPAKPRPWRTRKDPFAEVWTEILLWLQQEPKATAKSLLERLQQTWPGSFDDGLLRTRQRRVKEWRRIMARQLIYPCADNQGAALAPRVVYLEGELLKARDDGEGVLQAPAGYAQAAGRVARVQIGNPPSCSAALLLLHRWRCWLFCTSLTGWEDERFESSIKPASC